MDLSRLRLRLRWGAVRTSDVATAVGEVLRLRLRCRFRSELSTDGVPVGLAEWCHRQAVDKDDALGRVQRALGRADEPRQFLGSHRVTFATHHRSGHRLSPLRIRQTDDGTLRHSGVRL